MMSEKIKTVVLSFLSNKLLVTAIACILFIGLGVVVLQTKFFKTKQTTRVNKYEVSQSKKGTVEGISTKISPTPTPTIIKKRFYVSPIPTSTSQQNQSNNSQASNLNNSQSTNQSNSSNQSSNNNLTNQPAPTTVPTAIPTIPTTPEPSPTPPNDGSPFTATLTRVNIGILVNANKPLKSCTISYSVEGSPGAVATTMGSGNIDKKTCIKDLPESTNAFNISAQIESIYGESKSLQI